MIKQSHQPISTRNIGTRQRAISPTYSIEKILEESNLIEKGRYLPPNLISDYESSVVFIPEHPDLTLPAFVEIIQQNLPLSNPKFLFITPPGLGLSKLFEKEIGVSLTKTSMDFVQEKFPKLLVQDMELARAADLQIQNDKVILELTDNVLQEICQETRNLPRTQSQVGCLLSSAVACVLAKASGKVVTIQKDELSSDAKSQESNTTSKLHKNANPLGFSKQDYKLIIIARKKIRINVRYQFVWNLWNGWFSR